VDRARWEHQRPLRVFILVIVALVLVSPALLQRITGDLRACLPAAMSVGLWSASLPAAFIIGPMIWWWDHSLAQALMTAAALAIGPWMLTPIDQEAADQAEIGGAYLIQTAGRIASIIALVLAGVAMYMQL